MPQAVAGYYTALSKESGAVVKRVPANKLQKMCGTPDHQGVAARAAEVEYANLDDLFKAADAKDEQPFWCCVTVSRTRTTWVLSCARLTCGAHGVVIPSGRRRRDRHGNEGQRRGCRAAAHRPGAQSGAGYPHDQRA